MTIPSTPPQLTFERQLVDPLGSLPKLDASKTTFVDFLGFLSRFVIGLLSAFGICLFRILFYPQAVNWNIPPGGDSIRRWSVRELWQLFRRNRIAWILVATALILQLVIELFIAHCYWQILLKQGPTPLPTYSREVFLLTSGLGIIFGLFTFVVTALFMGTVLRAAITGTFVSIANFWFILFALTVILQFIQKYVFPWETWLFLGVTLGLTMGYLFSLISVILERDQWSTRWHAVGLLSYTMAIPIGIAIYVQPLYGFYATCIIGLILACVVLFVPDSWLFFLHRDPMLYNWRTATLMGYLMIMPLIISLISSWQNALICISAVISGIIIGLLRIDDWVWFGIFVPNRPKDDGYWRIPHVTPIPARKIKNNLTAWLKADWDDRGFSSFQTLVQHTNQYLSIRKSLQNALKNDPLVADKIVRLAESPGFFPYIEYLARKSPPSDLASIQKSISRRWYFSSSPDYSLETPLHAIATGFVYLIKPRTLLALPFNNRAWLGVVPRSTRLESLSNKQTASVASDLQNAVDAFSKAGGGPTPEEWKLLASAILALWKMERISLAPFNPKLPEPAVTKRSLSWRVIQDLAVVSQYAWLYRYSGRNDERIQRELFQQAQWQLGLIRVSLNVMSDERPPLPERSYFRLLAQDWQRGLEQLDRQETITPQANQIPNPFITTKPVSPRPMLTGPHQQVMAKIEGDWRAGRFDPITIIGAPSGGKTSVLQNLDSFGNTRVRKIYVHFDRLQIEEPSLLGFLYSILIETQRVFTVSRIDDVTFLRDPIGTIDRLIRQVANIHYPNGIVLLFDNFDKWLCSCENPQEHQDMIDLLDRLENSIPNLGLVITTGQSINRLYHSRLMPQFRANAFTLTRFDSETTHRMLSRLSADFYMYYQEPAKSEIYQMTGGLPLLVQLMGQSIVNLRKQQILSGKRDNLVIRRIDVRTAAISPEVLAARETFLGSLARNLASPLHNAILRMLSRSDIGTGRTARELTNDLYLTHNVTNEEVRGALNDLQSFGLLELGEDDYWQHTSTLLYTWMREFFPTSPPPPPPASPPAPPAPPAPPPPTSTTPTPKFAPRPRPRPSPRRRPVTAKTRSRPLPWKRWSIPIR